MFQSEKRNLFMKLKKEWGCNTKKEITQEEADQIPCYFQHLFKKSKIKEPYIDDITWNDLDMDKVFQRIDHTRSSVGEGYLYFLLRTPVSDQSILDERERLITFFTENEEKRIQTEACFETIGRTKKYSISDYIDRLFKLEKEKNIWHYFALFTIPFSFLIMLLVSVNVGFAVMILLTVFNIFKYYKRKGQIEPYLTTFGYILRMLDISRELSELKIEEIGDYTGRMKEVQKHFKKFRRGSYLLMSSNRTTGSLLDALLDYIRILTHIDLIKFNSMLEEVKKNVNDVEILIENAGILDAMISIASFRKSLSSFCVPQLFYDLKVSFKAEEIYHPLLLDPVTNSIDEKKGMLLTGSNASGKSTFLKTIAINAIMAQSIHTCTAASYKSCFYQIYSSMALKDNLQEKESYYIVEIRSLKRILNHSRDELPMLCCIDEVLRGTNTIERISASAQILKSLAKENVFCLAATHDIELTHLLEAEYDNYHFQEEVKDGDIIFNYRLHKGKAVTRNAIRLLGMMGYQETIIENAEKTAAHFMETGEWIL